MHAPAKLTILIVSHNKPQLLDQAVASVVCQSHANWQGILIDSSVLYDQGYFARASWATDTRLHIVRSYETPALRRCKAMAPWCFNECFRRGWVEGELVMYLCDDDILYPNAFATFVEAFANNPGAMAMYASQDIGWLGTDGQGTIVGERRARSVGGQCVQGRLMDCQVDYLQLCHRRMALQAFADTEYWPEAKATGDHADGLFMEKLGAYWPILPVDVKIGQNRRTPWSVNLPAGADPESIKGQAVHETIIDAWTAVRSHLDPRKHDAEFQAVLAEFQGQLRRLCEQDQAQRRRLVSQRYRLADKLQALAGKVPGAARFLKSLFNRERFLRNHDGLGGSRLPAEAGSLEST